MNRFRIGTADGKPFLVPDDLVTQTTTIYGKKGSGKTNTAVVLAEELLKVGQQVVIIEPLGKWYGLKSSKDGKKPGHNIVLLGGMIKDLPLDAASGEVVADFVVRYKLSCVISTVDFDTEAMARRFVTAFLTKFYRLKREPKHQTPVALIFEEARTFAPQQVRPDETMMLHAVQTIARNGRNFGIGVHLIDQRPASINKDVSSQTEMLVCHQLTSAHDKKAVEDWVKDHVEPEQFNAFKATVAKLPQGEAWVCSPLWLEFFGRVKIRERETFDSSATPKVGETLRGPEAVTKVNLDQLREAMAETIEVVKANDPELLKAEIKLLKKQLAAKAPVVDETTMRIAVDAAVARERQTFRRILRESVLNRLDSLQQTVGAIREDVETVPEPPKAARQFKPLPGAVCPVPPELCLPANLALRDELSTTERLVLDAAATFPGGATRKRISIYTGRSIKSSTFQMAFKSLMDRQALRMDGDRYLPTDLGRTAASPTKGVDLNDWLRKVSATEGRILRAIADAFPERLTRAETADRIGQSIKSSTVQSAFKNLCELELIEGTKDYRLNEDLVERRINGESP